jgi:hypothetical protein
MIDLGIISCDWETLSSASIDVIGFGHPGQFTKLRQFQQTPNELGVTERSWLVDPKTYGEVAEWLVGSCFYNKPLRKYILCLNNKPSSCKGDHTDILLQDWDPLGKHKGLILKLSPDDYGVGRCPTLSLLILQTLSTEPAMIQAV